MNSTTFPEAHTVSVPDTPMTPCTTSTSQLQDHEIQLQMKIEETRKQLSVNDNNVLQTRNPNDCNEELFEQINGTEITKGMMQRAQGNRWLNGLIVHNKNSIVIRGQDNNFGQPGFLSGVFFYNRLGVEVMNRYIVPKLIHMVNEK